MILRAEETTLPLPEIAGPAQRPRIVYKVEQTKEGEPILPIAVTLEQKEGLEALVSSRSFLNARSNYLTRASWHIPEEVLAIRRSPEMASALRAQYEKLENDFPGVVGKVEELSRLQRDAHAILLAIAKGSYSDIGQTVEDLRMDQQRLHELLHDVKSNGAIAEFKKTMLRSADHARSDDQENYRAVYYLFGMHEESMLDELLKMKLQRYEKLREISPNLALEYLRYNPITAVSFNQIARDRKVSWDTVAKLDDGSEVRDPAKLVEIFGISDTEVYRKILDDLIFVKIEKPANNGHNIAGSEFKIKVPEQGGPAYKLRVAMAAKNPMLLAGEARPFAERFITYVSGKLGGKSLTETCRAFKRTVLTGSLTAFEAERFYDILTRHVDDKGMAESATISCTYMTVAGASKTLAAR